jgi:hypothetical protein
MHWHARYNASSDRDAKGHGTPNTLHACLLQLKSTGLRHCSIWLCTHHACMPWLLLLLLHGVLSMSSARWLLLVEPCQCSSRAEQACAADSRACCQP